MNTSPPTSANRCGTCSLCCKVKRIPELAKPMYTWCSHCQKGRGCRLYHTAQKPASCTKYRCLWLATQSFEDPSRRLPIEFRPDRTKVVVDTPDKLGYKTAMFWPDPDVPGAMRSEPNSILIAALSKEYAVIEARGRHRKLLAVDPVNARLMVESGSDLSITEWDV